MNAYSLYGKTAFMRPLIHFLKRKKVVVMIAYGGVGEFLFQLDLAKRLEMAGWSTVFLVKGKYTFFSEIVQTSDLGATRLINAGKFRYPLLMPYVWGLSLTDRVTVVNSFNSTVYRWPTRMFYAISRLCGARVVISKHTHDASLPYDQIPYGKEEAIWKRNERIVEEITGEAGDGEFPAIHFNAVRPSYANYVHIHPVGSTPQKSYPVSKLLLLLEKMKDKQVVLTLTPKESAWYVNKKLENFLQEHPNVQMIVNNFPFEEIAGIIRHAEVFCTVNTGVLWLGIMLGQKVVVCDTFTDFEWNPEPYKGVTRLAHDYDEEGHPLHLVVREYPEGSYFASMYLVSPEEVFDGISKNLA